jgi:LysM repeat protein
MQPSPTRFRPPNAPPQQRRSKRRGRRPAAPRPAPNGMPRPAAVAPPRRRKKRGGISRVAILGAAFGLIVLGGCMLALLAGAGLLYGSGRVLPGVHAAGVDLGGMSEADAATALDAAWNGAGVLLRDGDRTWSANPVDLGLVLDAAATARAARAWGRSEGGLSGAIDSLTGGVTIAPVLVVDTARLTAYLDGARAQIDLPAVNAGVRLVSGQVVASPPQRGRQLDLAATVERMRVGAAAELADGTLDLVMQDVLPAINDASPLVAQANALLTSPFTLNGYDPIRDAWTPVTAAPETWSQWLVADSAPGSATGLALSLNPASAGAFVQSASASFGDERYLDTEQAVSAMQSALARSEASATVRVWHGPTTYTVQGGQTLAAIAEEIGMPYPYIQAVNPGVNTDALSVGQAIAIPSKDILVPLDVIPTKRIVVSRSQQHLWASENGQVVFDWVISTGLPSSPTALGVFQVQMHEPNAYAEQWNLYMPSFMGFYHPGPNMDLWNGFHGFPTRGGGYLLWSGDLGHPVTYGCILLSLENAQALYAWAQDGVVVEVRG